MLNQLILKKQKRIFITKYKLIENECDNSNNNNINNETNIFPIINAYTLHILKTFQNDKLVLLEFLKILIDENKK